MSDSSSKDVTPYDAIVDAYDIEHLTFVDDIELYLNLATAAGDPILELGCGTGRVLLPLAEAGFQVVGIDASTAMLDRAARHVEERGLGDRVTLVHADMRAAAGVPGGPFGLVILGLNSLLHLPSQCDQGQVLDAARLALDPRGQLVLDVLNPTAEALRELGRGVHHEGSWTHPAGGTIDKMSATRQIASEQILESTVWYDHLRTDGTISRTRASLIERYLYVSELTLLLKRAGFVEWQCYGSYDLDPYDDYSDRLLVKAEVTRSLHRAP
ncbi:MAG: class I SAM-dependent methyltransferase [Chloroflexia bacterium]|nr:class I SAM-dependent methyltransferase [Chloroflexia bacterium]